jgi:hypothetical protein
MFQQQDNPQNNNGIEMDIEFHPQEEYGDVDELYDDP